MPVDAIVHPLDIHEKFMSLENPGLIEIESIM